MRLQPLGHLSGETWEGTIAFPDGYRVAPSWLKFTPTWLRFILWAGTRERKSRKASERGPREREFQEGTRTREIKADYS